METISKNKVISSLLWKYLERGASQGISFIISVILARILSPDDFGVLALTVVFISVANVFVQTGFNVSLIQKKDADDRDFSSVFYISLVLSLILYGCIYLAAPLVALFYEKPELSHILRILALSLPFGAYNSVQTAIAVRQMKFKLIFYCTFFTTVLSGIIGVSMAYKGYGVWALVIQQLWSIILTCLIMQILVRWRPRWVFSTTKVKQLVSFGWKILISELIDSIYSSSFSLIIGKGYSTVALAYYNRGQSLPLLIARNINTSIGSVMLPVYSKMQDDRIALKNTVRRAIKLGAFIFFPIMIGLAAISESFIIVLYTEKWVEAIPFLQIFCFAYLFYPVNVANTQAINGIGRSDIFLKINIIKKLIGILVLLITLNFGVLAIAIGYAVSCLANLIINIIPNKRLLDYGFKEQCKDIIPSLILSVFMGTVVYLMKLLTVVYLLKMGIQILAGVLVYIIGAYVFKLEPFNYLLSTMISFVGKSRNGNKNDSFE